MLLAVLLASLRLAQATAAAAPPPPPSIHGGPEEIVCPIGGERFVALRTTMYSTHGSRPDGMPYGTAGFPLPVPVCPSNGLVVFKDFSPEEIERLKPLVASAAYRRLARADAAYYRAQWLAVRIGIPERQALWMLLAATWQTKPPGGQPSWGSEPSPARARAYQGEFVRRVLALPPSPQDKEDLALYARAANAQRELGRYSLAAEMLRRLESWTADKDDGGWGRFARQLEPVVARRDPSPEPLDMVTELQASFLCLRLEQPRLRWTFPATPFNRSFCSTPHMRELLATRRAQREAIRKEVAEYEREARERAAHGAAPAAPPS